MVSRQNAPEGVASGHSAPCATFLITIAQDEDGMFVVDRPAIPGCVSQGRTHGEAEANIREARLECLEVRREQGRPLTIEVRQLDVLN